MIPQTNSSLVYAHIGDLHLTDAKQQNYKDLLSIITDIASGCGDKIDMVYLPGDNADHADIHSYQLLSTALKMLSVPVYAIAGDHDMEKGNLGNFYTMPIARKMPFSICIKNTRCLFMDVCGNGQGGPDFRLGPEQLEWLENEAQLARQNNEAITVFMHTYPDDLKDEPEKAAINKFITDHNVMLVDMGHTHYNEIANDNTTIFTATRSTGQIEEGPAGYSIVSVYNNVVSWRFKLLDESFPFVLITYPADYRLATTQSFDDREIREVRAVVLSPNKVEKVECKTGNGQWEAMELSQDRRAWVIPVEISHEKPVVIAVKATDISGRPGVCEIIHSRWTNAFLNLKAGSDEYSIGGWPENHIYGTQLGPNRNAKPPGK